MNARDATFPADWETSLLDEIAKRGSGHTPDKNIPEYWHGGIKWISLRDSGKLDKVYISDTGEEISQEGIRHSSAVLHPAGVVVLSRDAGVGKSAITTHDTAVSQHFIVWKCGPKLDNHYLYYWLQYLKPEFERVAVGSTIKTIGLPYFKRLRITYPKPDEQRQIAAILLDWDRAIDLTTRLIVTNQERKRGLVQSLMTGLRRLAGFHQPWQVVKLSDCLTESRVHGSDGRTARKITVKLYGRGVVPKEERFAGSQATKYYRRSAGQFIYSKLDFLNGAFGIIPREMDGYESTLDLPCFDFNRDTVIPEFFLYFVSRESFYAQFAGAAVGGRKARRIQVEEFLAAEVKVPGLAEQQRIADFLTACDREQSLLGQQLALLKQQKQGLMQQLLTGKVRVPA